MIAGRFKGRALPVPPQARPAGARLRTRLFSVLGASLVGARVLDVCAGAGGLGLEALSRGAAQVTLLDLDPLAVRELNAWLVKVGAAGEGRALRLDAFAAPWPAGPFDLILLDPPFAVWGEARAEGLLERARQVVAPGGCLVVKLPARQALPEGGGWALRDRRAAAEAAFALLDPI